MLAALSISSKPETAVRFKTLSTLIPDGWQRRGPFGGEQQASAADERVATGAPTFAKATAGKPSPEGSGADVEGGCPDSRWPVASSCIAGTAAGMTLMPAEVLEILPALAMHQGSGSEPR